MKILLVSDAVNYSTADVYNGYCVGLQELKIPYETANYSQLLETHSNEISLALILAKSLVKENGFTHVLYVAATMIPPWMYESKYNLKTGVIAVDDPHSAKMLLANKQHIDYYFTCEKNMANPQAGFHYLPTAASTFHLNGHRSPKDARYSSDICFIGSVYPNRVKPLEEALKWSIKNNKKMIVAGPIQGRTTYGELFVPENSIIHTYGTNCIIDNKETLKYYCNAKVVINLDRDTKWSPAFLNGNPHNVDAIEPYSCNPRIYEVAASKTVQLYVEPRPEARDIFGDNIYLCKTEEVKNTLDKIFSTKQSVLNKKIEKCYDIVKNNHTYTHRTAKLIQTLIQY